MSRFHSDDPLVRVRHLLIGRIEKEQRTIAYWTDGGPGYRPNDNEGFTRAKQAEARLVPAKAELRAFDNAVAAARSYVPPGGATMK